jgi:hypothetical protein
VKSSFALSMSHSPVESSFVLSIADSPVQSSGVQSSPVQWSPVQSRFVIIVIMVQYIVKSTGIHWDPLESTGVHWSPCGLCGGG